MEAVPAVSSGVEKNTPNSSYQSRSADEHDSSPEQMLETEKRCNVSAPGIGRLLNLPNPSCPSSSFSISKGRCPRGIGRLFTDRWYPLRKPPIFDLSPMGMSPMGRRIAIRDRSKDRNKEQIKC